MNKFKLFIAAAGLIGTTANAQLIDEKDVSITLDLQPVLQLDMDTPDQLEFVFDEISEYQVGITNYAATILKVSSTVSWDLYAVARSQGINGIGFWDQQVNYGGNNLVNAVSDIPLSLLELKQSVGNVGAPTATGTYIDYSGTFQDADDTFIDPLDVTTQTDFDPGFDSRNSIYVDPAGGATPPALSDKYIAGHASTDNFMPGGTYLTQGGSPSDQFRYVMDYRILPGLPAIFPTAYNADGTTPQNIVTATANPSAYAQPGVYTMYVQYILLEDQ
ncbi:hypothetical protein [uncultured Polaribacter sp.]|uniref:hypothetical protein n=1 Tax=uncultured Polaribacter sp. TaxID=174711 RepID=UPI002634D3A4|nr:hypothetical protein [uncultured Polaribacter sp.]